MAQKLAICSKRVMTLLRRMYLELKWTKRDFCRGCQVRRWKKRLPKTRAPTCLVKLLPCQKCSRRASSLESVQDFLIKPLLHLLEISTFSLNNVIVRLINIMNRAEKNWAQFYKIKYLKIQNFQKHFLIKVGLLVKYSS